MITVIAMNNRKFADVVCCCDAFLVLRCPGLTVFAW
jgi:hypothetical protein